MRIAIDARSLTAPHKTGVSIVTDALIRHMAILAPEHEFLLFATGSKDALMNLPDFQLSNVSTTEVQVPNKMANLLWKIPGGLPMERFFSALPDVWLFPNAHIHRTNLPYVTIFHDATIRTVPDCFTYKDHARAWATNEEKVFSRSAEILSVSHHSKRDAVKYYGLNPDRISVMQLGVDHDIFLPREQPSDRSYRAAYDLNRPYLLWLATREPRKNADAVIRAYTQFRENGGEPVPLVLAGAKGWKMQAMQRALSESPYAQDIREVFYVPEKHKAALYRGATAFLFPSLYEGFGLPVLEAMACGTPVITSISSALPEVAGDAALYVDPLNITDITQALSQLLDSSRGAVLRATLRERGIARAQLFSWDTAATRALLALHSAVQSTPPEPAPSL